MSLVTRYFPRSLRHFVSARAPEVLLLQASPVLGALFGMQTWDRLNFSRVVLLLAGSIALTAHVFVFNDWAGRSGDVNDKRRARRVFHRRGISSREVAGLASGLLIAAMLAFAFVGAAPVVLGAAIAALSLIYSGLSSWGKGQPFIASLLHLGGGALHFLLGYSAGSPVDAKGFLIASFFGLVFAAGHLNQEVRDYEADLRNHIRTTAVVFGRRSAFGLSVILFSFAYLVVVDLVRRGFLAQPLIWATLLWPWHLVCSVRAVRRGLEPEAAVWMQRRYRLEFALLGLAMIATAPPVIGFIHRANQSAPSHVDQTAARKKEIRG